MLRLFQDNFIFGEATLSHFVSVTTSTTQQLHFRSSCFFRKAAFFFIFRTVNFSQQLFYQNSFFFRAKVLQSSHFLRIRSFSWQLLFRKAIFSRGTVKAGTSSQYQPFQESLILEKANFSEKQYSTLPTFSGELPFQSRHFFKIRYLLQQLSFQKSYFFAKYFFRRLTISQLRYFPQLHFSFVRY